MHRKPKTTGRPKKNPWSAGTNKAAKPLCKPLPMSRAEMDERGWEQLDVLFVTGDAYVDHPSFGVALLGRWLESHGFRVGVVAQPPWNNTDAILAMGRPRLFAGVTAGTLDSMLAHYTAFRKKRSDDAYTPGGVAGARPNRASLVYTNLTRQAFPGLPVIVGGVEASLRRASHYDFWSDKIRRSLLLNSKADLLVYGMAERALLEIAQRLDALPEGETRAKELLHGIPGTVFAVSDLAAWRASARGPGEAEVIDLPSHEDMAADAKELMTATLALERQVHQGTDWAVQKSGQRPVIFAPPAPPLRTEELDALHALPFTRRAHPAYTKPIPAESMIKFSVTAHRGCAGGCTFCSITLHQGRAIRSRSAKSIQGEVRDFTQHPDWKGSVSDVGGPTANMWGARCAADSSKCKRPDCLTPKPCPHFKTQEAALVRLLRGLRDMEGVKHLRVASGIRYDLSEKSSPYLNTLVEEFVGGQLKVAPEHCCDHVLKLMRKPSFKTFDAFMQLFDKASKKARKEQYLIPYLISAFPGCTDDDMRALSQWLRERGWKPQQVQCFLPTPGTVATAMFHAGIDTQGHPIHVAKTDQARQKQHRLLMPTGKAPRRKGVRPEKAQGRKNKR
jgi:uncharacterized radical SAM protein YgiQ